MVVRLIDLSHPLSPATPVFPGDPPLEVDLLDETAQTDRLPRSRLNCSRLSLCVHVGTHIDAPFHFYADGCTIEQVPLDVCVGECLLIRLPNRVPRSEIQAVELEPYAASLREVSRVVLDTSWSSRWGESDYFSEHPRLTRGAAELLVRCGVRLVGVDFPSVDRPPHEAHLELLGNGVVIVENLTNLGRIEQPRFELIAAPLAIVGRDGSPVRAFARVTTR